MDFLIENDDFAIKNNDLVLVDGLQETNQRLIQRLQFLFGEWFLDRSKGIPYLQQILKKGVQLSTLSSIFKVNILDIEGVLELLAFDFDYVAVNRTFELTLSVRTTHGVLNLTVPVS